jgi:hypothetical protein
MLTSTQMLKTLRMPLLIILISILPTLLLWLPFLLRLESFWGIPLPSDGMATVAANYDGPLYLVVAKTFYNADAIKQSFSFPLPVEYYAAHFPLFPFIIRLFAPVFGYLYSMLFVSVASGALASIYFYYFIKEFAGKKNALFVTFLFGILPARWLISRSVGSADPLFVASIIASIYHFRKGEYLKAGLWGMVAQLTKSPAIILFIAYALHLATRKMRKLIDDSSEAWIRSLKITKTIPLLLIPIALLVVFSIYKGVFGNYFAYFNSGDNIHLLFPPFQIFNYSAPWVGTFWLEEIIFIYLIGLVTLLRLIRKKFYLLAWFTGIFFASLLFVSHRDLLRYSLPIIPFVYVAFSEVFENKEFKYAVWILFVPIYLYSLVFISQNVMPISDWAPLI